MTICQFYSIIVLMNSKNTLHKILKNPICIVLSVILSGADVYLVYYFRKLLAGAYKICNMLSLFMLLFCIINVFLVYKDSEADTKHLFLENIPGIIFFIAFVACKLILRG